eukprot:174128-Ditylum_brightwellii.AAC.1
MGPYNDITKVYVAAVQHHKEKYHCSTNTTNLSPTNPPATPQVARQNTVAHANQVPKKNVILPLSQLDKTQVKDEDYVDESSDAELLSDGSFAGKTEEDNEILSDISLDGKECTYKEIYICDGLKGTKGHILNCAKQGCRNLHHHDCILWHCKGTEGIGNDNWHYYNKL